MVSTTSRTKKLLLAAALGLALYPSTGCTMAKGLGNSLSHHEALDDFMVGYRNQAWAAKAWHCRKHKFCNRQFLGDFENGFRDGYQSVADGGNGCVPAVCPQSYWGWQYQTADGQARMNAWFEGYPLGVQAAEQDGIGNWSQVRMSLAVPPPMTAPGAPGMLPGGVEMVPGPGGMVPGPVIDAYGAPVTGALSDQAEVIPTPAPNAVFDSPSDRVNELRSRSFATPAPKASEKAAESKPPAAGQAQVDAPTGTSPKATPEPKAAPKATPANKPPLPAASKPAPKATPAVPQPSADPFGFN